MYRIAASPVQDVTFGQALKFSLDNYYDLLKTQVGGLEVDEFLQLKLVADSLDLSQDKIASAGGYRWFSYYNLLNKSDRAITPKPIDGEIQTGLESLASHFEKFLRKLRTFVVVKELTPADQIALADVDMVIQSLKKQATAFYKEDLIDWKDAAEAMGFSVGDRAAYVQWSSAYGHIKEIEKLSEQIRDANFQKKGILDRKYPTPEDREVIDAEFDFENPMMRLRFPIWPDYTYDNGDSFSPTYMALLPLGSTALFDDRKAASWDKTLKFIHTDTGGGFKAVLDKNTTKSNSISTDWSAGGSAGYAFIKVNASTSEHKTIQEEFSHGEKLTLSSQSAMRININLPWFKPTLFRHKHVLKNPHDFIEFFGPSGSLLYYPTALLTVRGFAVKFESTQNWTYDYQRQFSASGGGGFNAFGINFGAKASYSSNEKEHIVDVSNTTLTIADAETTIRFVGYALKKNDVISAAISELVGENKLGG